MKKLFKVSTSKAKHRQKNQNEKGVDRNNPKSTIKNQKNVPSYHDNTLKSKNLLK